MHIHLGQAISRGERMDYTLQKSVELGVQIITPLFTERCGVDLQGERLEKRMQHWQQVIISACEQSGRCYIPELKAPCSLEKWLMELKVDLAWIMDPRASTPLSAIQKSVGRVALLCGPEGGLSELELDQAKQHGLLGLLMGPRILRTETAALTALSLLQAQWGDF